MIKPCPSGIDPLSSTETSLFVGLAVPQELRLAGTLWDACELHLGTSRALREIPFRAETMRQCNCANNPVPQ